MLDAVVASAHTKDIDWERKREEAKKANVCKKKKAPRELLLDWKCALTLDKNPALFSSSC